jgi:hypothetical protein
VGQGQGEEEVGRREGRAGTWGGGREVGRPMEAERLMASVTLEACCQFLAAFFGLRRSGTLYRLSHLTTNPSTYVHMYSPVEYTVPSLGHCSICNWVKKKE